MERLPGKHQEGVGSFRDDNDFADVTLACEDGQQVQAHKVILADSVSFPEAAEGASTHSFKKIRLKSEDLLAVVNFYHGEPNVFQESLDSFILAMYC